MFFKNLWTRLFFGNLYREYRGAGWSLVSHSPRLLNVALPDFSVQYYIASFGSGDDVVLTGSIPSAEDVLYYSIVVYDTHGLPVTAINDTRLDAQFSYRIQKPSTAYYAVVVRMYLRTAVAKKLQTGYLPTILLNGAPLPTTKISVLRENTVKLQDVIGGFLSKRSLPSMAEVKTSDFYIPAYKNLATLFPNPDALYLVSFPTDGHRVFKITGVLPATIGRADDLRFMGFMACNLRSTATDSCISFSEMAQEYVVWVACSKKEAVASGYNGTDPLLLWKSDNTHPFIVMRQVCVGVSRLRNISVTDPEHPVPAKRCRSILKSHYPLVTAL